MDVQVKSCNGITLMPINTRLLSERKVFIEGDIDRKSACDFIKQIMLLSREDEISHIDVCINSPGGEIMAGLLMYDFIQSCKTPIRMFCTGTAYSMAAILFACGNHGRYIFPNSEIMLHEPLLGNGIKGNASSIRSISDSLLESRNKINNIISKHTGKSVEEIEKASSYDHYFSPEESIEFGLADEIATFDMLMEG
ncbi:MAG: ATP-dependent Clp protease proteolytic subunit [Oscillospiraceae bacterium]|nr:ATP-dependent Clp protease proteolytic subunit [Oscillospiraceae bacterium]